MLSQVVIEQAVGVFIGLVGSGCAAIAAAGVKLFFHDIPKLKRDVDAAHKKLRDFTSMPVSRRDP